MERSRKGFKLAVVLIFLLFLSGSLNLKEGISVPNANGEPPPWAPAHGYRAKHQYRYYPRQRVYVDPVRGLYYYMVNSIWRAATGLPSNYASDLGSYIVLEMDSPTPYAFHSDVVKIYPDESYVEKESKKKKSKHKKKNKGKKDYDDDY